MININILAFSVIQQLFKQKSFEVETSASNIIELIEYLSYKHNPKLKDELLENNKLNIKYLILLNGKNITSIANLETSINNNDTIIFSTIIDGG